MKQRMFLLYICVGASLLAQTQTLDKSDQNMSLNKYARVCESLIEPLPKIDYRDAVVVPVTVDGATPSSYSSQMNCDNPSLLPETMIGCDGPCTPYSRLLMVRNDYEAQIVVMFRRSIIREEDSPLFDEIDLIMHSPANGGTCWFQAKPQNDNCDPKIGADGRNLPDPNSSQGQKFWRSPQEVVAENCGQCHDNDPFYYSPHVGQVREQLPMDPFGLYSNAIGPMKAWAAPMSLEPRGSTCIGCHRIGSLFTCGEGLEQSLGKFSNQSDQAKSYPFSHWMPIENPLTEEHWKERYERAVQQLSDCCKNPNGPNCNQKKIPNQMLPAH